jgi:2-dehydro-3-deoxyglucarate aldolase/4-hydroxy-2-oxoheptanedioate aldolase
MSNIPSIIPPNPVKQILQNGGSVVGTFVVEFRQPAVMQLLKNAGFNFVTIDNEHGAFSMETVADLARTAVWLGVTPIVRIPDNTYPYIAQTLDVGAQGLMVPRITHADQVRQIVKMLRYPPEGERGNAMERGLTQYRSGNVPQALEDLQQATLLIIQIETSQAIENLDEILSVEGVDVALVGPNDLSIALGYPGQIDHPAVHDAIEHVIRSCGSHAVCPGIHMGKTEMAVYWASQGMRFISTGSEAAYIQRGGAAAVGALQAVLGS